MCIVRARLPVPEPRRWLKRREAKGVERARELDQVVLVIVPCTLVWDSPSFEFFQLQGCGGYTTPSYRLSAVLLA